MTEAVRQQLVATAAQLFQQNGVRGTGLTAILKASHTPKGSLYYYFPHGKDELTAAAIQYAGKQIVQRVQQVLASDPDPSVALTNMYQEMAAQIKATGHLNNISISLIALETIDQPPLQSACADVFNALTESYTAKLTKSGMAPTKAATVGQFIQASTEGSISIAATTRQPDLLLQTADQLSLLIRSTMAEV